MRTRFARDQIGDVARRPAAAPRSRAIASNAPDIVESEVAVVVLAFGERDAAFGEHVAEGAEVQRLAVGDHAVEVEHDRADHGVQAPRLVFQLLSGVDRHLEPVFRRRVRALVAAL